jgi:Putative mono-oxygenase ydhR
MITAITTFRLPRPITRDQARRIFLSTASKYQGVPGLVRKVYVLSQEGDTAGGIYLWNSRAEADAMYTESWKAFVREKYGTDLSIAYFDSPVVVDNLTHEILSDE